MCEPTTIIAMSALAVSAAGQVMQANAQEDALQASAEAEAEETGARIQQEAGERVAQARRERARLAVAAGESGIAATSQSFEAQMAASFARQNRDLGLIQKNKYFAQRGIQTRADSAASNIKSGLQIAGETGAAAANVWANRPPKPE